MNTVLWLLFSASLSGALLTLLLLGTRRLWGDRLSRRWQYYIWLVVVARLLLPVGPETGLVQRAWQAAVPPRQAASAPGQLPQAAPGPGGAPALPDRPEEPGRAVPRPGLAGCLGAVWLAVALGMLIRKATLYQSFRRYVAAGSTPVADLETLDRLADAARLAGVRRPVELWVDPMISSPLLLGPLRPCIVLPRGDIPEKDLFYIALHELTHYKRRDMLYLWLAQFALCLHWFNPLVHRMVREVAKACEFSCDQAVLAKAGPESAGEYGRTLLDAMAAVGRYRGPLGASTPLSQNKELLRERLSAITGAARRPQAGRATTALLTLCVVALAYFLGISAGQGTGPEPPTEPKPLAAVGSQPSGSSAPGPEEQRVPSTPEEPQPSSQPPDPPSSGAGTALEDAERYYRAGSLPLFQLAFAQMDQEEQKAWLDRCYTGEDFPFFSAAADLLDPGSPLIPALAERAYTDGETAFFSALANRMDQAALEGWLDRALEDGDWAFQSMLADRLGKDEEYDQAMEKREEELEQARLEEYRAVGITREGKDYYFRGEPVKIFLDLNPRQFFVALEMNPRGTVNVKTVRDQAGQLTGAAYMTGQEAAELLEELGEDEDEDKETVTVPVELSRVEAGEYAWLGDYRLEEGDTVSYRLSAAVGRQLAVGFAKPGQSRPEVTYHTYATGEGLAPPSLDSGEFCWSVPAGEYRLFVRAQGGAALARVTGIVTITKQGK